MTDHPRNLTGFRFLARGAGAAVILIGGLVLAGWAFDVAVLKSLIPGLTAMNPGGTALAFLLAGVSLWAQASAGATPRRRAVGIACAAGVLLIGLARVGGYLAGWDGGPDQLLFRAALEREAVRAGLPNRMSPNTAAAFVLVGLALTLLDARTRRRGVRPAQLLALAAGLIALLALIGYAYSATSLIGVKRFIPMALNTAIAFAILSVGILCARPDRGVMAVVSSTGAGGVMARRLLPAAILIPAVVGWVSWLAQQAGDLGPGDGDVPVRAGQHRPLHGVDLVERGVARAHGPRASAGGAAPGSPVHGVARPGGVAPARRRRARAPAGDLRQPGLVGGGPVAGRPAGRRAPLRRPVALPVVPAGGIRGPEPADHVRPRGRAAGPRLGERPAGLDPGRRQGPQLPEGAGRGPRGAARALGFPVVVGRDILGVVEVFSGEIQQPDDELLQMLTAIGSQVGQLISARRRRRRSSGSDLLHTLMDTVPDSIYFKDAEGRFIRINKALADRFGWTTPPRRWARRTSTSSPRSTPAGRDDEQAVMETGSP